MFVVSVVCCHVKVFATGRSLDQRSSTDCAHVNTERNICFRMLCPLSKNSLLCVKT
jgi:hypothetical protein